MLRKTIFWLHLVCGVVGAVSIGIMCFTGTLLAFEKELATWAERDARRIEVPAAGTPRLSVEDAWRKLRAAFPAARPATMVVTNDPAAAFAFPGGRGTAGFYVNPYSGEARQPQSTAVGRFMQTMIEWHRYLGFTGAESRPRGKWINGAGNLAFCLLALTGIYLWIPRHWSWRGVKAVAIFNSRLSGKARDFNWHNVIGLWSAPVLIVLTLTAVPISFQWGGRVINALTGTPPPAAGTGASAAGAPTPGRGPAAPVGAAQPANEIPSPPPGTPWLSQDALLAIVQREFPAWTTITWRLDVPGVGGRSGTGLPTRDLSGVSTVPPSGVSPTTGPETRATQSVTFTVREAKSWPRTANITVALNAYTGEIARKTGYAELAAAAQVRAWTRFLHTGEALGWGGQLVAGLACAGGCVLVWTGLALAFRRFFRRAGTAD